MESVPIHDELTGTMLPVPHAERAGIPANALREFWIASEAGSLDLSEVEFGLALATAGEKYHFGIPPTETVSVEQRVDFYRCLHLKELALAQACALGREAAWQQFVDRYRAALTQAAAGITGSSSLGDDLAGSLYAELFGLKERGGERRSPFATYTGRGSLMGWLRAMLAQRQVDHHRRTHREEPLMGDEFQAVEQAPSQPPAVLSQLGHALANVLSRLPGEDRFLLASYFLDGCTLLQLARLQRVHEATISRRLKRLTGEIRKRLLKDLQARGMSRRAAEEMLGSDPRDLDLNLRNLLQSSSPPTFSQQAGKR